MVKAIVGANWGDEGKGKVTDMLAEESDIVVRFQGGSNAGHTIINDYGKFALHLLPSGVFYNHITSVIGNGVALNIPYLINEIKSITDRNVPMPKILVSDRAQIMMPYHIDFDTYEEEDIFNTLMEYKEMVKPFVCDTSAFLHQALKDGKKILLEGQLGSLKDPDHGIYPMVTSSSTLAPYGAIGAGIPAASIQDVVTVVKAYSSAVGAGAFVSEIFGDEADELRKRGGDGGEFGATTGRPRRMGWFDAVATRYGVRMQGTTEVALTVVDVLGYLDEIPICVGYEIDGKVTKDFPTTSELEKAKPVFKVLPGWKCDIRGIKNYEDLPEACRNYVETIEKEIEAPITMVSNGPGRHEIIHRVSSYGK